MIWTSEFFSYSDVSGIENLMSIWLNYHYG